MCMQRWLGLTVNAVPQISSTKEFSSLLIRSRTQFEWVKQNDGSKSKVLCPESGESRQSRSKYAM